MLPAKTSSIRHSTSHAHTGHAGHDVWRNTVAADSLRLRPPISPHSYVHPPPLGRQLDHAKIGFDRWHHTIVGCQDGGFMPISILTSTTPRATSMPTIPVIINRYRKCLLPSVATCFNFNGGFLQHETRFPSAQSTALLLLHS